MNPKTFFKSTFALATILFVLATVTVVASLELSWFSLLSTPECILLYIVTFSVFIVAGGLIAASLYALHEDSASYLDAALKEQMDCIIKHIGTLSTSYSNRNTSMLQELQTFREILEKSLNSVTNGFSKALDKSSEANAISNYMHQIESLVAFAESSRISQIASTEKMKALRDKLSLDIETLELYKDSMTYMNASLRSISDEILSTKTMEILKHLTKLFEVENFVQVLQVLELIQEHGGSLQVRSKKGSRIPISELQLDASKFTAEFEETIERLKDVNNRIYMTDEVAKELANIRSAKSVVRKIVSDEELKLDVEAEAEAKTVNEAFESYNAKSEGLLNSDDKPEVSVEA